MATNDAVVKTPRRVPAGPKPRPRGPGASPGVGRPGGGRAGSLLAYVLHSHDWSESSLIVELFTRAQGRVVVAAKGAKRPTSQLRAVLLPFQAIQVQLGKTPADAGAEIHNLRSAEWAGGVPLGGAAALFPGFYVNELLLKLLARQDPHPGLFDAYAETLSALAAAPSEGLEAVVLRAFELLLLREIGVLPELSLLTQTAEPLQADRRYTLHPEAGVVPDVDGLRGNDWAALDAALIAGDPSALRRACAGQAGLLRGPLRSLLHYHLAGSPLRTRQVWLDVQRLTEPAHR